MVDESIPLFVVARFIERLKKKPHKWGNYIFFNSPSPYPHKGKGKNQVQRYAGRPTWDGFYRILKIFCY